MNDERLTKRLENGAVEYESKGYIHRLYPQNIDCYSTEQRMILRLAELEDKIENGTLKEIPENAVVLTKEEYDKLGLFEETVQEYKSDNGQPILVKEQKKLKKYPTDIADFIQKKTVKEFSEKLKNGLSNCCGYCIPDCFESPTDCFESQVDDFAYSKKDLLRLIDKILIQYEGEV